MEQQKSGVRSQESESQAAAAQKDKPDSRLVRLVRVEREDGPATCVSYEDGSGSLKQWHPDPKENLFEVKAIIADAAVKSGFFAEAPDTKTRLRKEN